MSSAFGPTRPIVPPLVASAVFTLPDLDAVDAIYDEGAPGYIYARDGHPNTDELAEQLTKLHLGQWGVITSSGMAAISACLLPTTQAGQTILASDRLYGKTISLLKKELHRFEIHSHFCDTNDLAEVQRQFEEHRPTWLILETISNPLCRVANLPELTKLAQEVGCRVMVDNTFASPILCRPLLDGVDVVMESLTKMIGGHSDVTLGFLTGADLNLGKTITAGVSTFGFSGNAFESWLTCRSVETLSLRMTTATQNCQRVAEWLLSQSQILQVIYPGLESHWDFALAKQLLPYGAGHMLCFELPGGRDAVNAWMRACPEIPFAPSLGHAFTTCSYPEGTSHRFLPMEEKRRLGITPGLIRLSVGCEPLAEILPKLERGFAAIRVKVS